MRVCKHGCDVTLSVFPGTDLKPFQSRRKRCNLTLKYKPQGIQMKRIFPSFDLGIGHLFPSEPEEPKSKRKKNHIALHASMLVS